MDLLDPLFDAIVIGDVSVVNRLLKMGASLAMNDADGLTALHCAAASTEGEKLVPFLISKGADIDARDHLGQTPLHIHCARGRIYAVACLLHHGADPTCETTDSTRETAMQVATRHEQEEIVKMLLAYGAEPSQFYEKYIANGVSSPATIAPSVSSGSQR